MGKCLEEVKRKEAFEGEIKKVEKFFPWGSLQDLKEDKVKTEF